MGATCSSRSVSMVASFYNSSDVRSPSSPITLGFAKEIASKKRALKEIRKQQRELEETIYYRLKKMDDNANYGVDIGASDDENERLLTLSSYHITESTQLDFEDLVEEAKRMFNVPIVFISVMEQHQQIALNMNTTRPRNATFCTHALLQKTPLIIKDTTMDAKFSAHPAVVNKPHIKFYAGAKMLSPEGYAIGTFCVLDVQPRYDWRDDDTQDLVELATTAVKLLESHKISVNGTKKNELTKVASKFELDVSNNTGSAIELAMVTIYENLNAVYAHVIELEKGSAILKDSMGWDANDNTVSNALIELFQYVRDTKQVLFSDANDFQSQVQMEWPYLFATSKIKSGMISVVNISNEKDLIIGIYDTKGQIWSSEESEFVTSIISALKPALN
jgi:hypothetical protein